MERPYKLNSQTECQACELREKCIQVVPASGSIFSKIAFVGEAPGEHEDKQGKPFIGKAGMVLDSLLEYLSAKRQNVYITNVVKCRPVTDAGKNGKPTSEHIDACRPWLKTELTLLQPKIIVALGGYALNATTKIGDRITKPAKRFAKDGSVAQPRYKEWNSGVVAPFFHPAALVYPGAESKKRVWKQAAKQLKRLCAKLLVPSGDERVMDPSLA